jgi:hypothetical protein
MPVFHRLVLSQGARCQHGDPPAPVWPVEAALEGAFGRKQSGALLLCFSRLSAQGNALSADCRRFPFASPSCELRRVNCSL